MPPPGSATPGSSEPLVGREVFLLALRLGRRWVSSTDSLICDSGSPGAVGNSESSARP